MPVVQGKVEFGRQNKRTALLAHRNAGIGVGIGVGGVTHRLCVLIGLDGRQVRRFIRDRLDGGFLFVGQWLGHKFAGGRSGK